MVTSIAENAEGGSINASEASDGTPVVVGLIGTGAAANDTLTVNWGGQVVSYTLLAGDIVAGSATVTVPAATITAQGQGTFDVTATLIDAAGNPSVPSAVASVTVDTVGPAVPLITSIAENAEGGSINASEASDGTPVVVGLTGTGALANDTLTVNWGGQVVSYTLLAGDIVAGSATVTVPAATITAQGQGTFDVTATLIDAAGNPSVPSAAASVTVDTVVPAVAITTIEGGDDLIDAVEAAGGVTISGTAEIGSTLTVNGVPVTVDASGGWTTSVVPAGDGPLTVTAVATDAAGNSATATHAADGRHAGAGGGDHHDRGRRRSDQRRRGGGRDRRFRDGGDRLDADGERRGGDGRRQRRLDHLGGAGGRRPADGDGGGHRCSRQQRDGDPRTDGRHAGAGGGDHHDRGRRRPDQRRRGGGRDRRFRDGGDRLDADGERRGGDGRRQRRLDHLGGAGRRRPADGDGGGHRRSRQQRDGDPRR